MPKFTAYTTWSSNGITFANTTVIGTSPYSVFVDNNNTVYVCDYSLNRVQAWREGSSNPTRTVSGTLNNPYSVFVTSNGDIYADNGYANNRVDKWILNGTNSTSAMYVKNICYGLFVDINNNIYCSMYNLHEVVTNSLINPSNMWTIAAGTGCSGSTSNTLYNPRGIFVDTDLNLYVADYTNNRVQKFLSKQLNGITIAGTGATGTISLNGPAGVVLDADGYVFIADYLNNRIVGSGSNGFRCLVGCSTVAGSASNQLHYPTSLSFDSYGNIFVVDNYNNRIQKFYVTNNIYSTSINQPSFCPSTTWYTNAITFANSSIAGTLVWSVFIGIDNTVYVANQQTNKIVVWFEGSINPDKILSGSLSTPYDLFATTLGDIYVDNGVNNHRVDKFSFNSNISTSVMSVPYGCYGIFVDISDTLYCSTFTSHQVVKKWLNDNALTSTIVAGTGTAGSTATTLNTPIGIFVDAQVNLYVADCINNRIQMFPVGQFTGITVVGASVPGTITLYYPYGITLDDNGYLFIADCYNHRIVGSGPYGFRCLFGCTTISGSAPSQLYYPAILRFDSYGNLYVADRNNNRVQKFILASNSCSLSYNQPIFCSSASWSANAVTLASSSIAGLLPYGIFIDGINTVYVPNRISNTILSWPQWSTAPTSKSYSNLSNPYSLFMSMTGDIYIDNGYSYGRVDKYTFNTSNRVTVMNVNGSCYGLFIDISNNLYCSLKNLHQVVKLLLNSGTTIPTIAAGNGSAGSLSNMLNFPQGIYVDSNLNLYIADSVNNRIQLIQTGQLDGVPVVGNGSSANIILNYPTGIVLDANSYLFIVDSYNHRIVASSSTGFRCLVGCSGGGSTASQLSFPQSMAFDSYGNIYVTDRNNSRQYQPPPPLLLRAAAVVPPLALLLLPPAVRQAAVLLPLLPVVLQAVAVLQAPLPPPPVPLVALLQVVAVLRVPLPLAVLLRVVAVPPAVLLVLPPVPQAVVLQVALLPRPPLAVVLLLPPPQVQQQVAAAPQVVLLRAAAVPQVAPLLPLVLQQVAVVRQVLLPRAAVVPQVPLLRRPLLAVPLRAVAAPPVAVQRVVAVPQAAPLPPAVPQVALPPPPAVLQQVAVVPQVAVQRVVAVLQVLLLRVAVVHQVALPPPAVLQVVLLLPLPLLAVLLQAVSLRAVAVLQVVLPRAAVVPQVAAVLQVLLLLTLPLALLQVAPQLRPPLAVAALQVAVPQLVLLLPLAAPQVERLPSQLLKD
ncbi:unnamed protein product [Adineta steineri]|nr:unnamed protein product [Adineta steineri]CAF1380049.1 unnamed protein product [Adineta steineri]